MNSSLEKLLKNLSDNDFKYLIQKFGSKNLELLKQKDAYCYEYMHSFKRFNEEKLPDKKYFYSSVKDGTIGGNGKKLDGHISDESYLKWKKIGINLTWKTWLIITIIILKKDVLLIADVIDTCLEFYKLDPCHYFSSPGLSWDAMLTGITLLKDTVKQITNTWKSIMTLQNTYHILIWIICMVG